MFWLVKPTLVATNTDGNSPAVALKILNGFSLINIEMHSWTAVRDLAVLSPVTSPTSPRPTE